MRYAGTVIRPPSEARSYLLQVTLGCTHNRCAFCGTYLDKPQFRVRSPDEVREDIAMASVAIPETRRVFLCDGNALVLSTRRLLAILGPLREAFPDLQRVGAYARATDILRKGPADLAALRDAGLGILYLGLESGSDAVLAAVNKGETGDEMVRAVRLAEEAGIKTSVIVITGLAGRDGSESHALASAKVASAMNPRFLSCLTLMLVPGTPLHAAWERGTFHPLSPLEDLEELRLFLENLDLQGTIFRANHASNYLALAGRFPADKARLIEEIQAAIHGHLPLRPEGWRGL